MKAILVRGTLSKCLDLGRAMRSAREEGRDPIDAALEVTGGWRLFEGNSPFNNPSGRSASEFRAPVLTYPHGLGQSVIGGRVYRGPTLTAHVGSYFYGDFVSGRIWALVQDEGRPAANREVASIPNPSSFGEDRTGELFVTSFDGTIYRFTEPGGAGGTIQVENHERIFRVEASNLKLIVPESAGINSPR